MNKPELISPAGTLEKLKTAFNFGADAVYVGVPDFSLRARINNFTYSKVNQGTKYAHAKNKKIYTTLNIYAHNRHLEKTKKAIKKYKDAGVDALIISDPGILSIAKKIAPKIDLHLSTQANCTNWQSAKFWYEHGVKRIILAREVTLKEIAEIHKRLPKLELEYFVHGAMCMSYSGRCILSKLLSERSANLGACSQPCRWEYDITEHTIDFPLTKAGTSFCAPPLCKGGYCDITVAEKNGKQLHLEQDQHGTYILNSKDLCLIKYLAELTKAGISSFKIEGRTKSAYYVAAITKLYRQTIDNNYNPPKNYEDELKKITNRGYTTGFLFGEEKCEHNFKESHRKCDWQFVGEVIKNKKNILRIKVHNGLYITDEIEFITPIGENIKLKLDNLQDAKTGKPLNEVHGGQNQIAVISVNPDFIIPDGSMLRRKLSY
ncbi:U32 family peptidase [Patescibacteria group bacterium]